MVIVGIDYVKYGYDSYPIALLNYFTDCECARAMHSGTKACAPRIYIEIKNFNTVNTESTNLQTGQDN